MLLSHIELDTKRVQVSDYNKKVTHAVPAFTAFSPASNLIEMMFSKEEKGRVKMIAMSTSFCMMCEDASGDVIATVLAYDADSQQYVMQDKHASEESMQNYDAFYKNLLEQFNDNQKGFVTFQDILKYCKAIPDDQPKYLPISAALVDFDYLPLNRNIQVNTVMGFHPKAEGEMQDYSPPIAALRSEESADKKHAAREFIMQRLGEHSLDATLQDAQIRRQVYTNINTESTTHEAFAQGAEHVVDLAKYKHKQAMPMMQRFWLSVNCGVDSILEKWMNDKSQDSSRARP